MDAAFSTDQRLLYAELSDTEKKTTILLQTQITSEELSVEAKVRCKHHGCPCQGGEGIGLRLGMVGLGLSEGACLKGVVGGL